MQRCPEWTAIVSAQPTRTWAIIEAPFEQTEDFGMTRIVDGCFRLLRFFMAACLMAMVVLVFGNVVLRYGFNSGITVSEELGRWLFVWLTFIGAVVAMRDRAHLGMDSVVSRLPLWGKRLCFGVSNLLMLYAVWLFANGSWRQTIINLDNFAPATGLSTGLFYGVGLFFSAFAAVIIVYHLYALLTGRISETELIQTKESTDVVNVDDVRREGAQAPAQPRPGAVRR
jgi:TRAP-type C4-dicarboxylate transport system permease small subunit